MDKLQHDHQHNHHDHDHDHVHHDSGKPAEVMQPGDDAIQSAFTVGLFVLKGVMVVAVLAWLYSGFYKVENGESAVEFFLGEIKPYNGSNVRQENLYWSLPFPFTQKIKLQVKKETSIREVFPINPNEVEPAEDPLVKGQLNYFVTKDMNLLHLGWELTYRIKELDKFVVLLYEEGDINKGSGVDQPWMNNSRDLIANMCRASMMEECSHQKAMDILTGKNVFNQIIKEKVQDQLNRMNSGLEITSLSIVQAVPPSSVKQTFIEVLNAKQRKSQNITESQRKKEEVLLAINSDVKKIQLDSQNDVVELVQSLKAEASRVETINHLFKDNPAGMKNYLHQLYLEAASEVLSEKSIQFIDRPENAIFRKSIFSPNKDKPETRSNN